MRRWSAKITQNQTRQGSLLNVVSNRLIFFLQLEQDIFFICFLEISKFSLTIWVYNQPFHGGGRYHIETSSQIKLFHRHFHALSREIQNEIQLKFFNIPSILVFDELYLFTYWYLSLNHAKLGAQLFYEISCKHNLFSVSTENFRVK